MTQQSASAPEFPAHDHDLEQTLFDAVLASFAEGAERSGEIPSDDEFDARLTQVAEQALPRLTHAMLDAALVEASVGAAERRARRAEFQAAVRRGWGDALNLLELLIDAFHEYGRDGLLATGRAGSLAGDARLSALGRLHARACRTAYEVLSLLECGLADGALARCRTLHEIAIVGTVLGANAPVVAERYTRHAAVRAERAMRDFNPHHAALGWEPIPAAALQAAAAHVEALVEEYGSRYRHDYGWADGVVAPAVAGHKVAIQDLERAAGLAHYRPFGDWASGSVHAGPQGLQSLGHPLDPTREVLYAGGSTSGLADPGQHAALSLGHFVAALAPHLPPSLERLARGQAVTGLVPR
ncbi:hypothetical protein tb265_25050 [Gemmatimonadetes bacterium T265]|nr:hypothetical protein tb265_25050 [Gemmatimonadetes bacterium T265]